MISSAGVLVKRSLSLVANSEPTRPNGNGALFTRRHSVMFLARVPGSDPIFSRGPVPTPGSRYTVNVAAFDYNNPYGVVAIPSYRQIIDWSDPDKSLAMHSTGQSGLVFSKHYDDMISSWLKVQYHTMLFNKTDVEADRQSLLALEPSGN